MKTIITRFSIEILDCDFLFAYCDNFQLVKNYVVKHKKKFTKSEYKEILDQDEWQVGMVLSDDESNLPYLFYINNRKKGWFLWDTLLHETNHLVFYLAKHYDFREETEFQARLQEHIFSQLRSLINK